RTKQVVARIMAGSNPQHLAFGAGSLWVANGFGHYLTRIDPATNRVLTTIPLDQHGDATHPWDWCACASVTVAGGGVGAGARDKPTVGRTAPRPPGVASTPAGAALPTGRAAEPCEVGGAAGALGVTTPPHPPLPFAPRARP